MRMCLIRICVLILFWTAFPGDAPKWRHAPIWRVIWARLRMREVRGFPVVNPVPHHGTWAFQGPSSGRMPCTKGACPVGTHTHPLRQPWWQEPQHQGCSPCLSYVGLSFTRAHYIYCIAFTLYFWFIIIVTLLLYNAYIICVHIYEC